MDVLTRLQGIPFLEPLSPQQKAALARLFVAHEYVQGEDILSQGEVTTRFFIVDKGYVNLRFTDSKGIERAVGSKGPGEYFGVKMFTTQEPSEYTYEAVGVASLFVIERQAWDQLCREQPDILEALPQVREELWRQTRGLRWLAPGEIVAYLTGPHWWGLLLTLRLPALVLAALLLAFLISTQFPLLQMFQALPYLWLALIGVVALWITYKVFDWSNERLVVTNQRVVSINKVPLISESRSEIPIDKIQQVNVQRGGPISILLGVSDLTILSAASSGGGIYFRGVGHVERIRRAIDEQKEKLAARERAEERERLRRQLTREIKHHVLREVQAEPPPRVPPPRPASWTSRWRQILEWGFGTEIRSGGQVTWRKHYIILLEQTGGFLAATALVVIIAALLVYGGVPNAVSPIGFYAALAVLLLVTVGGVIWQWLDWRNDLYQLTETEIIDIESLPLGLNYNAKHAKISNLQDVTWARPRLINTLLNFGNVDARVAGDAPPFTFTNVPRPDRVASELNMRIQAYKLKDQERQIQSRNRQIIDALIAYHRLAVLSRLKEGQETLSSAEMAEPAVPASDARPPDGGTPPDEVREFPPEEEYLS